MAAQFINNYTVGFINSKITMNKRPGQLFSVISKLKKA